MTTAPAQLRSSERIPRWNMRLTLMVLISLFCLAFVLFGPLVASGENLRQLPVGLHSVLRSDYSASARNIPVAGVGLGLIESALKDQAAATGAPERIATVVRNLDEIVPTVTPIGGAILSPTAPVFSPTPTKKPTLPVVHPPTSAPTSTQGSPATATPPPTKTWAPTKTPVPPTSLPPTAVPTEVPPTAVPPTAVPPTAVPPTPVPTSPPAPTPVPTNPPAYPPPPAPTSPPPEPTSPPAPTEPPAPTTPPAYP
jgi:hypothetical protein